MKSHRQEIISWNEVEKLISLIKPQLEVEIEGIIMIAPDGVIPAGMLAAALGVDPVYLAQVKFPPDPDQNKSKLFSWPEFVQFPKENYLADKEILIVNNAWGAGRRSRAVFKKVETAGGIPHTCVLHYNPYRNLLNCQPEYYAAITDAYIIYPWEIDPEGPEHVLLQNGGKG